MRNSAEILLAALLAGGAALAPIRAGAESFTLDAASASGFVYGSALLAPSTPPPASTLGAQMLPYQLGLIAGDVIDALSYRDDGPIGSTLYFSVNRVAAGSSGPVAPDVFSE